MKSVLVCGPCLAALMAGKATGLGERVGVILSGGNISPQRLVELSGPGTGV